MFILNFLEWCKVYSEEDNKCHTVSLKSLEIEDSEFLTESNLKKGQTVLLKVKVKKYTSTIVEVYGKFKIHTCRYRVYGDMFMNTISLEYCLLVLT